MSTIRRMFSVLAALALFAASPAGAQGLQTGIISGTITTNDGLSLPGATVSTVTGTISSVNLASACALRAF